MLPRFQRGGRERESGERVSTAVRAFGETVKQNDSGGLLFERLPACQFRRNVFIDSLRSATWQPCRGSTFLFHTRSSGFVKQVPLENLGKKSPTPPCVLLLKQRWQNGNVYAPDPENKCFRSKRAHILSSEVVIDCVLNRYSIFGFMACHRADLLCARNFSVFEEELQAFEGR